MKKIMLFMFGLSLFYFQNSQVFGQSESAFASELSDEIADIVNDEMKRSNIPGVFVTVVSEDGVIYQNGFGYSDKSQHSRVDEKTLFELGSVSKSFTGLALLKLEAEEKVRLTEPVSTYLPNISFTYNGESAIVTIADFLSHRSGLPFNTIAIIPETDSENALIQTVENLNNIALAHPPGEKYEYATINYDVLGLVIQKVTGVSYEEYVRTNIFEPLSLNETFIGVTNGQNADKSKGYKLAFGQAKEFSSPVFAGNNPAGYIFSSGNDLAKWLTFQLGLSNTDYLDSSIIASSHQINVSDKDGFNYAAGWFVYDQGQRIYHGGNNPNFSAFVQFYPEKGIGIGVLTNLNTLGTDNIGFRISDLLTGDTTFQGGSDENQLIDFYATIIFWVLVLLNSFLLIKVIMIAREIKKGQRTLKEIISLPQIIGKSTLSLMIIGLLVYCFHQVPYVFLGGLNWSFLFVWLPHTIKAVYFGSLLLILLLFVYLSMLLQFPKKNIELSPLLILSIISGLGNAFVILVINTAIGANEKASLIPFFFLGITLYIYTQQLVRSKVIEVSNEIIFKKRIEIIQKILKTPYEDFESMNRGTIQATLNNDTEAISNSINALVSGVTSLFTIIVCFVYLLFLNHYVFVLSLLIVALISAIYFLVIRYANGIEEEARDYEEKFFSYINSLLMGFKELALNRKKKREFEGDLKNSSHYYKVTKKKAAVAFANVFIVGELIFTLAVGVVVLIFPIFITGLSQSDITSYVFVLLYMVGPIHAILDMIPGIVKMKVSLKRINQLSDHLSSEEKDEELELFYESYTLTLDEVEYRYPNDTFSVGPLSLSINSGEITFIIGGNGSGKSTLAKLITGLYKPNNGYIQINRRKISSRLLNEHYSAIFNDFFLFDKLYGVDTVGKEKEIEAILELLRLQKKVVITEGKFSTLDLSTGQRKRLALLVAYLDEKPIYVFDEWTADQDPEFRKFFYHTLLPELKAAGKGVVVITHDDRYFDNADKVFKMENGNISIEK